MLGSQPPPPSNADIIPIPALETGRAATLDRHHAMYSVQCSVEKRNIALCRLCTCTVHCVHFAQCTLRTLNTAHCTTMHTAHYTTLHSAVCSAHYAHCKLCTATSSVRILCECTSEKKITLQQAQQHVMACRIMEIFVVGHDKQNYPFSSYSTNGHVRLKPSYLCQISVVEGVRLRTQTEEPPSSPHPRPVYWKCKELHLYRF